MAYEFFDGAEAGGAQTVTSPVLTGARSYELSPPADTVQNNAVPAGEKKLAMSFAFRFNTVPGVSANRPILAEWRGGTPGHGPFIRFNCTSQKFEIREGLGSTTEVFGPTVLANTWYLIDFERDSRANPWILTARAMEVGGTWDGTEGNLTAASAASDITGLWIGSNSAGDSYTAYYDDWWLSSQPFPLGLHSPPPEGTTLTRTTKPAAGSFTIDGRPVPLIDWQCESVVDWGDRTLTGKLPRWVTWAQQGSRVVAWRGPDDAMWAGELTADPRDTGDWLAIRAHGDAQRISDDPTRMFYRIDGGSQWVDADSEPHELVNKGDYDLTTGGGFLKWRWANGSDAFTSGEHAGFVLWVEGALITYYEFLATMEPTLSNFDIITRSFTGPSGSSFLEATHGLGTSPTTRSQVLATPSDALWFRVQANANSTPANRRKLTLTQIRVYGRTTDPNFSVSDVVADVGASAGLVTDGVRSNGLRVLPLDWTEDHADLLTYMAELADWRWLVRHDGLHFGPYERVVDAFMPGDAVGDLEPERRHNIVTQPFRGLSGRRRARTGSPTIDPYPGQTFALTLEDLADPQPDADLAEAVAEARADYEASRRLTGSLELVRIRADGDAMSPYFISPGDLLRIPNLAPGVAPQRVKAVTYRPDDRVSVDLGTGFNVVRTLADAAKAGRRWR